MVLPFSLDSSPNFAFSAKWSAAFFNESTRFEIPPFLNKLYNNVAAPPNNAIFLIKSRILVPLKKFFTLSSRDSFFSSPPSPSSSVSR